MSETPLLSIIIVNWNVRELLRECIASILRETRLPRHRYEIIVVDNDSADGSVEMLRADYPEVLTIANPVNSGFAAGCNIGYAASRGRFILLLNPDTVVAGGAVDGMLEEIQRRPQAGVLGARLVDEHGNFQRASGGALPSLRNVAWNYLFLKYLLPRAWAPAPLFFEDDARGVFPAGWVSGAAMLLRREAAGATIFDESFFLFGEDMDVCDRLRREGRDVLYTGDITVMHYHGRSYQKQSSMDVLATAIKGPRKFFRKKYSRAAVFVYDLILLAGYLARWPLFRLVSFVRPGRGYAELASFSRRYIFVVLALLVSPDG
jgi:N-acetylglucosaminyl-diphospho-decaprenol L-rhamnosyltransferase